MKAAFENISYEVLDGMDPLRDFSEVRRLELQAAHGR
jgi:hypothetical protein